jgi:hypothetical protein
MALLDFGGISLQQHIKSGDEFLIGLITDWGRILPAPTVQVATFSTQAHSLKSLAIGPDSDIDQVSVRYALPAKTASQGPTGPKNVGQLFDTKKMSIDAPFNSAIRDGAIATGPLLELIAVDQFTNLYYAEGVAAPQVFGEGMNALATGVWAKQPTLQVVLSGSTIRLPATWGRRNTMFEHYDNYAWFDAAGLNTEGVYKVWPIHGRKKVKVTCRATGNGAFRVRLSTVGSIPSASNLPIESQIAPGGYPATTAIPASGQATFDLNLTTRATFLIVYATRTGPAAPAISDSLAIDISASDA